MLDFDEMKKRFIQEQDYEAELNNFKAYLINKEGNPITITILGGIRTEDIIKSIKFNIERNTYSSKSIAYKYMTAIAQFYRYAINCGWFTNDNLIKDINSFHLDENSYFFRINSFIVHNTKLKFKQGKDKYTEDEIILLLDIIDEFMSFKDKHNNKIAFEKITAMLSIKLMILLGIKYKILKELRLNDYDKSRNLIEINDFSIRLPITLGLQLQYYIKVRNELGITESDYLFVDYEGNRWGKTTSHAGISYVLKSYLGRTDTSGIIKYGITNLLSVGTDINQIQKLTGSGKDIIKGCMLQPQESEKQKMDRYLNKHIANMDIYYRV